MIGTIFSKLFSIIMLAIFALSVLLLILTYRKPKKLSLRSLGITLAMSMLSVVFYVSIIGYSASFGIWFFMALFGALIGYLWARTSEVYIENDQIMSRNSVWYLVVWGGVFALNQIITTLTSRPPAIAMAMLIFSTFIVWGTNGSIIRRYYRLRPVLAAGQVSMAGVTTAAEASPVNAGTGYNYIPPQPSAAHDTPLKTPAFERQAESKIAAAVEQTSSALPEPFRLAQSRLAALKNDRDSGALSSADFLQTLNELRFEDDSGAWWQVKEDGQSWLKWNGKTWLPAVPGQG
jgi:hypothetical protein